MGSPGQGNLQLIQSGRSFLHYIYGGIPVGEGASQSDDLSRLSLMNKAHQVLLGDGGGGNLLPQHLHRGQHQTRRGVKDLVCIVRIYSPQAIDNQPVGNLLQGLGNLKDMEVDGTGDLAVHVGGIYLLE